MDASNESFAVMILGAVLGGVAGTVYLAGVIRWAVSGTRFYQLRHAEKRHLEIINLLECIVDKE